MTDQLVNGTIYTRVGEPTYLTFGGLPTDKNYKLYLGIKTINTRETVGNEIFVETNNSATVDLVIPVEVVNLLEVPLNKSYNKYTWGIKLCYHDPATNTIYEKTIIPKNNDGTERPYGSINYLIVYPEQVKGI